MGCVGVRISGCGCVSGCGIFLNGRECERGGWTIWTGVVSLLTEMTGVNVRLYFIQGKI